MRLVVTMPGTLRRVVVPFFSVPQAAGFVRTMAKAWGTNTFAIDYKVERA